MLLKHACDSAAEFDKLHGKFVVTNENRQILFEDGCYRDIDPMGIRCTPKDPWRIANFRLRYRQIKLNLAVREFTNLKQNLINRFVSVKRTGYPLPEQNALDKLEELKSKVEDCKELLATAEANKEKAKPQEMIEKELAEIEHPRKCGEFGTALDEIEI